MKRSRLVTLIMLCGVFVLPPCARCQQADYPWVYYFEREVGWPFPDADGSVIVSTGDWNYSTYNWGTGDSTYWYLSDGVFRIREGEIDRIQFPADTLVSGFGTDSAGTTWALFGEGESYTEHTGEPPWRSEPTVLHSVSRSPLIANPSLGRVQGTSVVVDDELTASIPLNPVAMVSDTRGRVFVTSRQDLDSGSARYFVSWWSGPEPTSVHIEEVPHTFDYVITTSAPSFGPDGLVYFLVSNTDGVYYARAPSGVLALDPETGEWHVYYGGDKAIYCVYVDQFNVRWIGAEDGLARFSGGSWACWTTANSGLL